jgi:hypoxanthine-guanine phosphoribosyltransferase
MSGDEVLSSQFSSRISFDFLHISSFRRKAVDRSSQPALSPDDEWK